MEIMAKNILKNGTQQPYWMSNLNNRNNVHNFREDSACVKKISFLLLAVFAKSNCKIGSEKQRNNKIVQGQYPANLSH